MDYFLNFNFATKLLLVYLVLINIVTFFVYATDKFKSQSDMRRISEKMLWLLALVGGSLSALLSMHLFRHKTKKTSFQAGLAIILTLQIWLVYYLITK